MMPPAALAKTLAAALRAAGERPGEQWRTAPVHGGCSGHKLCLASAERRYFLKLDGNAGRLLAEADGLQALARCRAIVVPAVVAIGTTDAAAFLLLEWLNLGSGDDARLGEAVAELHAIGAETHGWHRDNHLGATPQRNTPCTSWRRFFVECRLRPLLALTAGRHPAIDRRADTLLQAAEDLLAMHEPPPALCHGDLWRGNTGFVNGRPALFDPAVHFGDAEADLAMAALFGGFSPRFFAAWQAAHPPRDDDADRRRRLYQIPHLLNHAHLFGGDYPRQAASAIDALR